MAKLLSRGFSIRLAAGAVLFFGCALAARPADVVILKDGFTIQGNVRKETSTINDPFAKSMTILKADGFDFIDDGVRLTIFSTHNKQLGEVAKDTKLRPDYKGYSNAFSARRSSHPLPFMGGTKDLPDFNEKWRRTIKVVVPPNDWDKIDQQIT